MLLPSPRKSTPMKNLLAQWPLIPTWRKGLYLAVLVVIVAMAFYNFT